ncbi:TcfC E-set like domain-containing protein [Microbulbifer hainanensis]|uniref:TcfC E-set like domain-containing protein n=1 Tax=Microbulbifer hainanensis TaxID=2735675 RepID=UPI001D01986A|nr:TcfC E-set like domain-containing protein [Microbulbifer hainanensis]
MKRAIGVALIALVCCARCNLALAASAAFTLETGAPEGFADLTGPQQLVADVYFGGKPVGTTQVTVNLHTLRFNDPEAVLNLLPETLAPDEVLNYLGEPQLRNSHRVCYSRQQPDCGFLKPDTLGVIYDPDHFRVDVFIAPAFLPQQAAIRDPYLPESSSGVSFMQNLTGTWSGVRADNGRESGSASLFGQSILSFGESGLHSQWSAVDNGQSQVYELNWTRDYRGRSYALGLIQPQSGFGSFVPSPYLYGAEYKSSNNSRSDNRYQQGAPIEVNMPVRGRAEIFRDGRLLHSQILEAGNQLIDTSGLPGGAYDVEIRTFDYSGRPLAQYQQFFAKDAQLPAPGEWRWSIQAGRPAEISPDSTLPEGTSDYFLQAGVARRVTDNGAFIANVAGTGHQQLAELGARWIGGHLELSPSLLRTSDGSSGHRLYALVKTPYFTLGASETKLDTATANDVDYSLLGRSYYSRNASLTSTLYGGQLSLRYSEQDRGVYFSSPDYVLDAEFTGATYLTTLEYRRNVFRSRYWLGELSLAHSDADGDQLTTASIQFRYRNGRWSHSARLRTDSGRSDGQNTRLGFNSAWNDGDRWIADVDQQFTGEFSADDRFLGSSTRIAGRRGRLTSTLDYRRDAIDGGTSLNYLGSFSTNLLTTGRHFAWGGEQALNSAIMVNIDGSAEEDFEILVNGVRRGTAKGGDSSVINLPAFQSYDLTLKPLSDGFYDYREMQHTLTLYPGNVATTSYDIKPVILVLGRIVRAGEPVARAKISIGGTTAETDEFGVFQLEWQTDPRKLQVPSVRWKDCSVQVPQQASGENWLNLGDIDLASASCMQGELNVAQH